ncbi:ERF family protein [Borrelia hermsii]|nr:ERF family protein [Borrelia hermsii]
MQKARTKMHKANKRTKTKKAKDKKTNVNKITKIKVQDVIVNNQGIVTNENHAERDFLKSLYSLRMHLSGIGKNLNGYGYKYQDFNEIVREIKNVIKNNNLDIDFVQYPTLKSFDGSLFNVITTTFYSPKSAYRESFDTPIYTEELKSSGAKNQNTLPQLVGSCITYFKRYALVAYLSIESEVDTDASALGAKQEDDKEQASNVDKPSAGAVNGNNRTINTKAPAVKTTATKTPNVKTLVNKGIAAKGKEETQPVGCKSVTKGDTPGRIPAKYYYYRNLLQAAKRMHPELDETPFDSIEMIDNFLLQLKFGNDSDILGYFEGKPKLKTIEYWTELINKYLTKTEAESDSVEDFSKFLVYRQPKYGHSPLRLFGYIASDKYFKYLCQQTDTP